MAVETKAPERIYLQDDGDFEAARELDLTWCEDRINDGDTEYVRADLHAALQKRYEEAMEALREAKEAAEHWSVCDFPDEVDYRCADCNAAQKAVETARALLQRHKEGV